MSKRFLLRKQKYLCNAPFTSMYFRPDGAVSPCCFNTEFIYGRYPEASIEEIWNGKKIREFRNFIKSNDLSHGCDICRRMIVVNNLQSPGIQHYKDLPIKKHPVKMEFELAHVCNLNCIMCLQNHKNNQGLHIYNSDFVNELKPFLKKLKVANFFGGEPFLNNTYYQIWNELIKSNQRCICYVQTNGTIFNEKIKSIIENGNFALSVSIDSIVEETYRQIRVNSDYTTTLKNVDSFIELMSHKQRNLAISVCPMKINISEITELIDWANERKINIFFNTVVDPPKHSLVNLDKEALLSIRHRLSDYLGQENRLSENNKSAVKTLLSQIETNIGNWDIIEKTNKKSSDADSAYQKFMEFVNSNTTQIHSDVMGKMPALFTKLSSQFPVLKGVEMIISDVAANNIISVLNKDNEDCLEEFFTFYMLYNASFLK